MNYQNVAKVSDKIKAELEAKKKTDKQKALEASVELENIKMADKAKIELLEKNALKDLEAIGELEKVNEDLMEEAKKQQAVIGELQKQNEKLKAQLNVIKSERSKKSRKGS